nr:unnamed protein product [Callosobruchus chinensis]
MQIQHLTSPMKYVYHTNTRHSHPTVKKLLIHRRKASRCCYTETKCNATVV